MFTVGAVIDNAVSCVFCFIYSPRTFCSFRYIF